MAYEYILLIPNLGTKGKRLREKLLSISFSDSNSSGSYSGTMGGSSNLKDIQLTMFLTKDTHNLFTHAASGEHIPEMQIEVNDSTPTTLKTAMLYDFKDLIVTSAQMSGSHDADEGVTVTISFIYASVKATYFK